MRQWGMRLLSMLLLLALCVCFTGCSILQKRGGLGSLRIDDPVGDDDDVGVLGSPQHSAPVPTPHSDPVPSAPAPQSTPVPTPPPTPSLQTELYERDGVRMTIPAGWDVFQSTYPHESNQTGLLLFVTDPQNPCNQLFFLTVLSPFFTSTYDRDEYVSTLSYYLGPETGGRYAWAPVLNTLSARSVVENWASLYKLMELDGSHEMTNHLVRNYVGEEVVKETEPQNSDGKIVSQIVCTASIQGATGTYLLQYGNVLQDGKATAAEAAMLPTYYNSWNNNGLCVAVEQFDAYYPVMVDCLNSLDISEFNRRYN